MGIKEMVARSCSKMVVGKRKYKIKHPIAGMRYFVTAKLTRRNVVGYHIGTPLCKSSMEAT